jgi:hypothetical protein
MNQSRIARKRIAALPRACRALGMSIGSPMFSYFLKIKPRPTICQLLFYWHVMAFGFSEMTHAALNQPVPDGIMAYMMNRAFSIPPRLPQQESIIRSSTRRNATEVTKVASPRCP